MTISNKLMEVYASAPSGVDYVETLEFSHTKFTKTFYFTNDNQDWDLKIGGTAVTYVKFPFKIKLPSQESGSNPELTIVLANAGLEMMQELEAAQVDPTEQIKVVYRVYMNTANTEPAITTPLTLHVTDVVAEDTTISMTANRFDILGRQFPKLYYTTELFAGLKR